MKTRRKTANIKITLQEVQGKENVVRHPCLIPMSKETRPDLQPRCARAHCMTLQTLISCLPAPVGPAKMHLTVIYNEKGTT